MNKTKIHCAECRYTATDKKASDYSQKHCGVCDVCDTCEVCRDCKERDTCKARTNSKLKQNCDRRFENVCSKQTLRWEAIQCACPDSEYYRALLNVTPHGNKQQEVSWSGCAEGERRRGI